MPRRSRTLCIALLLWCTQLLAGCMASPAYGLRTTILPSPQRVGRSFLTAAKDPQTWAPLAGALLMSVGDVDEEIVEWASDRTPLFGSRETANKASDTIRDTMMGGSIATIALTPSSDDLWAGVRGKAYATAVGVLTIRYTNVVIEEMKDEFRRKRPLTRSRDSFPSAHTAWAASFSALARRHLETMPISTTQRTLLSGAFTAGTALTAWSRLEAGRHYPSDVLAGWGISNFLTLWAHDTFVGRYPYEGPRVQVTAGPDQVGVQVSMDVR